jgi:serine/threonine-protein phosphatase 2A regulatory subunit B''
MKVKRIISRHSKQPNSTTTDPSSLNNPMTGTDIATATTPNTTTHPMSLYDTSYGDPTANIGNTNTMRMDGTTTTPPSHHSTNNPFYNTFSSWNDDNDDDDNVAVTTTTKSINNNNNTPKCVRDVVQIIYYDTIRPITPHHNNDNNYNDDADDNDNDDPMNNHLPYKILLQQPILSPDTVIPMEHFHRITKDVCHFPSYFNTPFYQKIINVWNYHHHHHHHHPSTTLTTNSTTTVTIQMLEYYWKRYMEPYDDTDRFFYVIKPIPTHIDYIIRDDFLPYIQALLREHPGLEFLSSHGEFQEKYAVTVITRIYYCVNTDHSGRITSRQIRHSDLYPTFQQVDQEDDINKVTRYFSYEHFYVLYCRFWELDQDRDYKITREDLLKYGDHSLSHMIVDRIFDAAPRPFVPSQQQQPPPPLPPMHLNTVTGNSTESSATTTTTTTTAITTVSKINRDYLSYEDFIYFMLSEEDKSNEIAVRYWFQCVDVDGDGKLNNMEMRSFYAVQLHRMSCMGHETVPFEDMLCQMMDMMKPANTNYLVVSDFLQKECRTVSGALFDALFSLNKYMLFEQRDPFHERQKREDEFSTDWDRFACMDYNRLAMEEEAREEEAMEIDWVTVDDEDDDDLVGVSAGVGGGNGGNGSHNSNTNGAHLMGGEPSH